MYLKRLELQGFKSFPEKVRLEFQKGITAVVGPNGSGKSNISDAVRWVLGEQRIKTLRGERMEDIIFAGTEARKPVGFAEVSLTLDNEDHSLPLDYTEVTVTRRVFRSGESEYTMNKTACRLKDIHELFLDTGIGREGYSIIGQGRIDALLSSKDDERRRLFEEAAGIGKYKARRAEALQKLEKEEQNLLRLEDIWQELMTQLPPLEKQAEAERQYLSLKEKQKTAEAGLFCLEADRLKAEEERLLQAYSVAAEQLETLSEGMHQKKETAVGLRADAEAYETEIEAMRETVLSLRTDTAQKEAAVQLLEEQVRGLKKEQQSIQTAKEAREAQHNQGKETLSVCESRLAALQIALAEEERNAAEKEATLAKVREGLATEESERLRLQEEMTRQMQTALSQEGELSRITALREEVSKRRTQLETEIAYLTSRTEEQKLHAKVLETQIDSARKEQADLLAQQAEWTKEAEMLEHRQEALRFDKSNTERELGTVRSRYGVLSDMEQQYEGFHKSVRLLLQEKRSAPHQWKGILGPVGELIEVEARYEMAIEIALGQAVQNVLTQTEEDAKEAIAFLKKSQAGRATFLPVNVVRGRGFGTEKAELLAFSGVLGTASDLVICAPEFREVIESLLGRTLVAENMDAALLVAQKTGRRHRIVTLEGDLLNPGGAMTGGSQAKRGGQLLGRGRELAKLKEEAERLSALLTQKESLLAKAKAQYSAGQARQQEGHLKAQKLALQLDSYQKEQEQTALLLSEQAEKLENSQTEQKNSLQREAQLNQQEDAVRSALLAAQSEQMAAREALMHFSGTIQAEEEEREQLLAELTQIRIRISKNEEQTRSQVENRERIRAELEEMVRQSDEDDRKIEASLAQAMQKESEKQSLAEALLLLEAKEGEIQAVFSKKTEERKECLQQLNNIEEELRSQTETAATLKQEVFQTEAKQQVLKEERRRLFESMWEAWELTYQAAQEIADTTQSYTALKRQTKELKNAIASLGTVHVGAIEMLAERQARADFLAGQRADLMEGAEKLQALLSELSERMRRQFTEEIHLLSESFGLVFQEMFGGGRAYLRMADGVDSLESPIEIIAQPPGKSLQNMLLLSGGERALTAIALLFAILRRKPSPFCVLDEIEAALDDANVKRYAKYLSHFSKETQFIVITHRKGTMEAADSLYGVTMQEKGVSKLLSVAFSEREQAGIEV